MHKVKYCKINIINLLAFLLICFLPGKSFAMICDVNGSIKDTQRQIGLAFVQVNNYSPNSIDSSGNQVVDLSFYLNCWNIERAVYVYASFGSKYQPVPNGVYGTITYAGYIHDFPYYGDYTNPEIGFLPGIVNIKLIGPQGSFDTYAYRNNFIQFGISDDHGKRYGDALSIYIRNTNTYWPVKTCNINQGSQTIALPDYDENIDNRIPINISVNCSYSASLSFSLSGSTDGRDDSIYLNSAGNGAAQNLGVSFYYNGSKVLNNHTIKVSDSTTNSVINLAAGYAKMPGVVTAGVVMAKATLTITYN